MKVLLTFLAAIVSLNVMAQGQKPGSKSVRVSPKYQLLVELDKKDNILQNNHEIKIASDKAKAAANASDGEKGAFLDALSAGFGTSLVQKTQNATTNLMSVGVNYLVESMKSKSKKWYATAQSHCSLSKKLKSEIDIKDFYAAPSNLGAMDPQNIQFKGFGCHHYLAVANNENKGNEVFFIFCSMRRDSVGICSIVNHSKFLVQLDSLMFKPKYCGLPNDSLDVRTPFDFSKRKDLTLSLKARIYSSWINEAIMITNDQLLGEFTVTARIDPSLLNEDSVFIYKKGDPRYEKLVSVSGDCFIVPRSFTGTIDGNTYSSTWGTGQYRIEMDVNETCKIVDSYYYKQKYLQEQVPIRQSGNGEQIAFAGIPEYKKFDKAKWKVEWTPIKQRKRNKPLWKTAWDGIVTAYKGSGWVQTFTDPLTNVIVSFEGKELNDWLGLTGTSSSSGASSAARSSAASQSGAGGSSGAPTGGGMPQGRTK